MSYPFDWIFSKMWKINELFRNRFLNFFARNILVESRYTGNPARYKDAGITYVHDGKCSYLQNDDNFYNVNKAKYDRRVSRLLNLLDKDVKILFIRLRNEYTHDEHIEFTKVISEYYPNCNYKLLVINMDSTVQTYEIDKIDKIEYANLCKINRYTIGGFIREKYNIPFVENCKKEYND